MTLTFFFFYYIHDYCEMGGSRPKNSDYLKTINIKEFWSLRNVFKGRHCDFYVMPMATEKWLLDKEYNQYQKYWFWTMVLFLPTCKIKHSFFYGNAWSNLSLYLVKKLFPDLNFSTNATISWVYFQYSM